ncbi:MAG: hypothetical protein C4294_04670, partial [Nitrospiraceae bacterium]
MSGLYARGSGRRGRRLRRTCEEEIQQGDQEAPDNQNGAGRPDRFCPLIPHILSDIGHGFQ